MAINVIVQYNAGFPPDILPLTQAFNYALPCHLFCCVWWPGMAINVSVQYNDAFLPDIKLSIQGYYYRGTHLNAMKRFCICSL